MDYPSSKEAVALALWRAIRETSAQGAKTNVDADLALFTRCLDAVENRKGVNISAEAMQMAAGR